MPDIVITYNGSNIKEISSSGTKTIYTKGTYCKDDIDISYLKPPTELVTIESNSWSKDANDILEMDNIPSLTFTNLLSNGDFSNGTTGWSAVRTANSSISVSNGTLILTHTSTSNTLYGVSCSVSITSGHTYYIKYKLKKTMSDSDGDARIIQIRFGTSDVATCIRNITQDTVLENVCTYKATTDSSSLQFVFGGNIATTASSESMLEVYYAEIYDVTDILP